MFILSLVLRYPRIILPAPLLPPLPKLTLYLLFRVPVLVTVRLLTPRIKHYIGILRDSPWTRRKPLKRKETNSGPVLALVVSPTTLLQRLAPPPFPSLTMVATPHRM